MYKKILNGAIIIVGGLVGLLIIIVIGIVSGILPDTAATQTAEAQARQADDNQTATTIALTPANTPTPSNTPTATSTPSDTPIPTDTLEPTDTPIPTDTPEPTETRYIDAPQGSANLRSGPGTTFNIVGELDHRDRIEVTGRSDDSEWYRIEYEDAPNRIAWFFADLTSETRPSARSTNNATSVPNATVPPAAPCSCTGPDLDCSDFASHNAAQACYDHCVSQGFGNVHNLDGDDNDGRACERLP